MPEKASSRAITLIVFEITLVTSGLMMLRSGSLAVSAWSVVEGISATRGDSEAGMVDSKDGTAQALLLKH